MKVFGVSILILFSFVVSGFSIDNNTKFKHITVDDGLPQSNVTCIFQDAKGHMWFGTKLGVTKYNGYSYETYTYEPGNEHSLTHNHITNVYEDKFHNIWICTIDGINRYNPTVNKFFAYYLPAYKERPLIFDIYQDSNGLMWICASNGVFNYIFEKDTIVQALTNDNKLFNKQTYNMLEDEQKTMWFACEDGIYTRDVEKGNTLKKYDPKTFSSKMKNFLKDANILWILSDEYLYKYNLQNKTYAKYAFPYDENMLRLYSNINRGMLFDDNGKILIGTYYGILVFNPKSHKFSRISHTNTDPNSLSDNAVHSMFRDNLGDYWIGTSSGGLNYVKNISRSFKHYNNKPLDKTSLASNIVNSFYEDSNGDIYVGSSRAGLNKLDITTSKFSAHLKDINIRCILEHDKNNIWLATLSRGLILYNIKTGEFKAYKNIPHDRSSLSNNHANYLFYDSNNTLWVGTNHGLNKFDEQKNSFSIFPLSPLYDGEPFISYIKEVEKNILWIGTYLGIFVIDIDANIIVSFFSHIKGSSSCLPSNFISEICVDNKDRIWVGTGNGLSLYQGKEEFKNFYVKDGLAANTIVSIISDNNNYLWIGTANGLSKFDPDNYTFTNYDYTNGLQSNEFRKGARYKCRDGSLIFGGVNGFNIFHPDSIKINNVPPPVYITNLMIYNEPYKPAESEINSEKNFPDITRVVLNHKQAVFTIHFSAINYNHPEKNEYKYKMIGVDKSWNYVKNQRSATYTHLSPGKYEFKVCAANNDGVWNNQGASLYFTILPPFWKTTWFYILSAITIIIILLLSYRLRFRFLEQQQKALKKKVLERTTELNELNVLLEEQKEEIIQQNLELTTHREKLEKLVQERTRDLENAKLKAEESDRLKTAFLTNMSHEIRTPMHAIIGFSGLLSESGYTEKEQQEFVAQIRENSKSLLVLIDDIIDFSLMEAKKLSFRFKPINLFEFVSSFAHQYFLKQIKPEVKFRLNIPENSKDLVFSSDPIRIKQILNNLILNAYKFTKEGYIELGYSILENSVIRFYVRDTGIGIDKKNLEVVFDRFRKVEAQNETLYRGAGLGLAISKSLVNALGGEIGVESEKDKGSIFYFTIPIEIVKDNHDRGIKTLMTNMLRLKNKNILIAEDEESNFFFLDRALKNTDANIIHAKNGKEAVELVKNMDIDLVLMDIKMPIMDGYEAAKEIRKINFDLPIIALSAFDLTAEKLKIAKAGFNGYYNKPMSVKELMNVLGRFFPQPEP